MTIITIIIIIIVMIIILIEGYVYLSRYISLVLSFASPFFHGSPKGPSPGLRALL
jgi:hypothetical protein